MRIAYRSLAPVSDEELGANHTHSTGLGLRSLGDTRPVCSALAIVGSGPSVPAMVERLRDWEGAIWAINGAYPVLRAHGIEAAFFSIDPVPAVAEMARGARSSVLATTCNPATFAAVEHDGCRIVDLAPYRESMGSTTASCSPLIAMQAGYETVTYLGCESSFDTPDASRARQGRLLIEAGGAQYLTTPGLMMQAELLSEVIRAAPHVFMEASGGLLRAMTLDPNWTVVAASQSIHDQLEAA